MDILCCDCGTKLGEMVDGSGFLDPTAHSCFDCWHAAQGHASLEWLHVEQQPLDIGHMSPITTVVVVKRGPYDDILEGDEDLTVSLVHHDLRDAPLPMLMGNPNRKLSGGICRIDGLYVRGTGVFRLKIESPGHDPLHTFSFRVT